MSCTADEGLFVKLKYVAVSKRYMFFNVHIYFLLEYQYGA